MTELRRYMEEFLEKGRQNLEHESAGSGNLLSALVHSLGEAKETSTYRKEGSTVSLLSRADALGDIYVFSLAGHETTGNALSFAIYLLAAHPEVQAWVQEKIDSVYGNCNSSPYELLPRLKRCLPVLLETLRLFPSVVADPKLTQQQQQTLQINGRDTGVNIPSPGNLRAGSSRDPTEPHGQGVNEKEGATGEDEDSWQPAAGTIFPWSDGSRVCPEMRYSEVEFVAILSTLLQQHHVEPRRQAGDGKEAARQRTLGVLGDCLLQCAGLFVRLKTGYD
ncbi:MAG: hypothetical protein LQ339_003116 [Xanthoria mediterranea]|nr:MAG: hypothetical protein LQ339_003116 [Xanthoria mediterranea]